jgi:hypothetical protein
MTDLAIRIQGMRDADQAAKEWPAILGALGRVRDGVKRLRPNRRRNPSVDHGCDWLHRTLMDAPIAEGLRAEAAAIVAEVKKLVGPPVRRRAQSVKRP